MRTGTHRKCTANDTAYHGPNIVSIPLLYDIFRQGPAYIRDPACIKGNRPTLLS